MHALAVSPPTNRRLWLKSTGAMIAALTTSTRSSFGAEAIIAPPSGGPARLSSNENPFGPSASAIAAMQSHLTSVHRYPFDLTDELIAAISNKENVSGKHIVLGVGSSEILQAVGRWAGEMKGEVVTASPSYLQPTDVAQRAGSKIVSVPVNDRWEYDLEAMAGKVTASTKLVYICNPNNPTGTFIPVGMLKPFIEEISKRTTVMIDEAYLECSDDFRANTMVGLVRDGHDVIVTRTFSKIHGLAGQRIGYGLMQPATAEKIRSFTTGTMAMNLLGLVAAKASLLDHDYVESTRLKIKSGRDQLIHVLTGLNRRYAIPQGNFIFFHTGQPIAEFQKKMRTEGIQVARPFPPMLDWCRITIGLPQEMERVHLALRKIFDD